MDYGWEENSSKIKSFKYNKFEAEFKRRTKNEFLNLFPKLNSLQLQRPWLCILLRWDVKMFLHDQVRDIPYHWIN
jgi:hypothetical protein